jgi:DNA-directed RNA polymerase specialized sigma24 family protein
VKPSPEAVLDDLEGLRALARSLVHGDTEADDLIQDTAIAAITHPPEADRPARPWLAMVLRNRWRMNRRTDSRTARTFGIWSAMNDCPPKPGSTVITSTMSRSGSRSS